LRVGAPRSRGLGRRRRRRRGGRGGKLLRLLQRLDLGLERNDPVFQRLPPGAVLLRRRGRGSWGRRGGGGGGLLGGRPGRERKQQSNQKNVPHGEPPPKRNCGSPGEAGALRRSARKIAIETGGVVRLRKREAGGRAAPTPLRASAPRGERAKARLRRRHRARR